jgi:hypothetical protein
MTGIYRENLPNNFTSSANLTHLCLPRPLIKQRHAYLLRMFPNNRKDSKSMGVALLNGHWVLLIRRKHAVAQSIGPSEARQRLPKQSLRQALIPLDTNTILMRTPTKKQENFTHVMLTPPKQATQSRCNIVSSSSSSLIKPPPMLSSPHVHSTSVSPRRSSHQIINPCSQVPYPKEV